MPGLRVVCIRGKPGIGNSRGTTLSRMVCVRVRVCVSAAAAVSIYLSVVSASLWTLSLSPPLLTLICRLYTPAPPGSVTHHVCGKNRNLNASAFS